jgi:hypothetical protein
LCRHLARAQGVVTGQQNVHAVREALHEAVNAKLLKETIIAIHLQSMVREDGAGGCARAKRSKQFGHAS